MICVTLCEYDELWFVAYEFNMNWRWWIGYEFDMRYGMVHGWADDEFGYDLGMWFKWNGWLWMWHGKEMS